MEASPGLNDHHDHDPIYADLLEPDAIRLLELYPGPMPAIPLMGSLIVTTLRACEADLINHYTALSYVWGDPAPADTITLAGGSAKLGITANLSAALKDIRHTSEVMTVWVDAVCINQADVLERNRQVGLMREIYSYAASTIIYLGPLSPGMSLIFDTAVEMKQQRMGLQDSSPSHEGEAEDKRVEEVVVDDDNENSDDHDRRRLLWRAVEEDLCRLPWFGRGWVFQELMLSRDPRIQCGRSHLRWDDVLDAVRPIVRLVESGSILDVLDTAHGNGVRVNRELYNLVLARRGCHVTDPRDLFYSLMGLASDHEVYRKFLIPDYSRPVREVYIAAARYMQQQMGLSSFLQFGLNWSATKKNSVLRLPSWVPDWGVQTVANTTSFQDTKEAACTSNDLLDEGSILLVEQLEDLGVVERLTDVFPRGTASEIHFDIGAESNVVGWNKFIDPVKNTVSTIEDPFEVPNWPESDDAKRHYKSGTFQNLGTHYYQPSCLALVVSRAGPDADTLSSTYCTVSAPAGVALGDSLVAFKSCSLETVKPVHKEEDVIYGFRRSLKEKSERAFTEYGEVPLYELVGVHTRDLKLRTRHDNGKLMAFY
ncbi:HET-domain-containing protein [Apiospora rasikravindrae]|uniref:HET-domain-containing protein n=1 Tax=Apiospora rasikravindrae TaxID=990691 RepID=A0ABR1RN23_9PEZI